MGGIVLSNKAAEEKWLLAEIFGFIFFTIVMGGIVLSNKSADEKGLVDTGKATPLIAFPRFRFVSKFPILKDVAFLIARSSRSLQMRYRKSIFRIRLKEVDS